MIDAMKGGGSFLLHERYINFKPDQEERPITQDARLSQKVACHKSVLLSPSSVILVDWWPAIINECF